MSGKVAQSHSRNSNRANLKARAARKEIFKSVITNPFQIQWPLIPPNAQHTFLATLLESTPKHRTVISDHLTPPPTSGDFISSYMTIGINQVTRRLESQLQSFRKSLTLTTGSPLHQISCIPPSIAVLFVCRPDVNPPTLLDHIPHLVAGCNSTRNPDPQGVQEPLKLIVLPKGSEPVLAQALGLRRAAVIAIHGDAPFLPTFHDILQSVPIIRAPWLVPPLQPASPISLISTHIKQLRTSAPKDMKAAKEQRVKARAAARAKPRPKKRVVLTTAEPDP